MKKDWTIRRQDDGTNGNQYEFQRNNAERNKVSKIFHFRELEVYRLAKKVALEVFEVTKKFPKEERYALTDQIHRASRSVCSNLAEAWRRRRYKASFVAKLNDCESECAETQVCLEFALHHKYIDENIFKRLDDDCEHVSAMLVRMCESPNDWTLPNRAKP